MRAQAQVRPIIFALVLMLLGLAVGAILLYRPGQDEAPEQEVREAAVLSEGTRAVLQQLTVPVELRFYSILDSASVPESMQAFAGRVDALLAEFEREGGGMINVIRYDDASTAGMQAAAADGITSFNRDRGNACFLGVAVVRQQEKELLPRLAEEWEPALELDVTRAIVRVSQTRAASSPLAYMSKPDVAAADEVKRIIPNLGSVSVEEGTRLLREAALEQFKATANEMEAELQKAQQRLRQAQSGDAEAEKQAALQHLQQLQAEQSKRLQEIAARVESQIAALEELKGVER